MRRTRIVWACLTLAAAACGGGSTNPPDTGDAPHEVGETGDGDDGDGGEVEPDGETGADADADDDADDDGGDAGRTKQTVMTITSGGGRAAAGSYVLQLSIGTPQPMGSGVSGSHRLGVGPGAVQNQ